jgi:hypothetical protein
MEYTLASGWSPARDEEAVEAFQAKVNEHIHGWPVWERPGPSRLGSGPPVCAGLPAAHVFHAAEVAPPPTLAVQPPVSLAASRLHRCV